MENFIFKSPTKFILERDAERLVGQEIREFSDNVLFVHYGGGFIHESGIHKKIMDSLHEANVKCFELAGVQPNPILAPVYEGIKLCRENNIKFILSVGGGSVIDTAKAIAAGALYDGDVWDLYTRKSTFEKALPIGTVMTLPATGSEGSNGSVITNENTGAKLDIMHDCIRPVFAIMNPEITYTVPMTQTANGIVDMLSHVMERYFSNSVNTELIDRVGEGLMKGIIENAKKVMANSKDYDARADLMWASILAHNGLVGTGRNQDWACHVMGAQLSGEYNSIHGHTLSVLIPAWASYVYKNNVDRFVQFAHRVFGVEVDFYNPERTALEGIERLKDFYKELNMPLTMQEIGINTDEKFEYMANNACANGNIGCIMSLSARDVENIYRAAF